MLNKVTQQTEGTIIISSIGTNFMQNKGKSKLLVQLLELN